MNNQGQQLSVSTQSNSAPSFSSSIPSPSMSTPLGSFSETQKEQRKISTSMPFPLTTTTSGAIDKKMEV